MPHNPLKKTKAFHCTRERIALIDKKRQLLGIDKAGARVLMDMEDHHTLEWIPIEINNSSEKGGHFYV